MAVEILKALLGGLAIFICLFYSIAACFEWASLRKYTKRCRQVGMSRAQDYERMKVFWKSLPHDQRGEFARRMLMAMQ